MPSPLRRPSPFVAPACPTRSPSLAQRARRVASALSIALGGLAAAGAGGVALGCLAGCSKNYIPNTDVEDTSENRKIIFFCEDYRHAVEDKDVAKLLSFASPQYFEDGGNTQGSDDIDIDGLKDYLTSTFAKTLAIRYEIRYRRVTTHSNKQIFVDYTYAAAYKIPTPKGDEWKHTVADNRLVLVPEGDSFKILSGM
jgi:hypothetical protein